MFRIAALFQDWWARLFPREEVSEKPKAKPKPKPHENFGTWYYLHDLLDRLDKYEIELRRMKKVHPDAYAFYRRIGAQIVTARNFIIENELPATWRVNGARPTFGMFFSGIGDELEEDQHGDVRGHPSMFWFLKQKWVPNVEAWRGDIYECGFYTDWNRSKPITKKYIHGLAKPTYAPKPPKSFDRYAMYFWVEVSPEGEVRLLKCRYDNNVDRNGVPKRQLKYPPLARLPNSIENTKKEDEYMSSDDYIAQSKEAAILWFHACASVMHNASDGFRVSAKHEKITAVFNIDLLRTPYFFADRNKTVTENGRTKPIFHIVRTHKRRLVGGAETFVKSHFRGVRKFKWHKWGVVITMPGYHHESTLDFDVPAYHADDRSLPRKKAVEWNEMARVFGKYFRTGKIERFAEAEPRKKGEGGKETKC